MVWEALIFYNVFCISLWSNRVYSGWSANLFKLDLSHLTDKSLQNNKKKSKFAPEKKKFVAQSFTFLEFGSLVTIVPSAYWHFSVILWYSQISIHNWFMTVMPSVPIQSSYMSFALFWSSLCFPFDVFCLIFLTQALLSKLFWSCPLAHWLFSWWLCCGGCSWNSLLHVKKPWQISKNQTSDFTFNPSLLHACVYKFLFSTMFFAFVCDLIT